MTEALLARFLEERFTRSSARLGPDAVAGRVQGLLRHGSMAQRVFQDLEDSEQWQVLRSTRGSNNEQTRAAEQMYTLFSDHMHRELVERRRKQRAFTLRELRMSAQQSPLEFGLKLECELQVIAPACSVEAYLDFLRFVRRAGRSAAFVPAPRTQGGFPSRCKGACG